MMQPVKTGRNNSIKPAKPSRRLRNEAAVRAFRFLARSGLIRHRPGEHFGVAAHPIVLDRLPRSLHRMRICHLSDLHVGPLLTLKHLPAVVEAANAVEADLIAVTGDMLDDSADYLEGVVEQMAQLRAPLGVYFVLGNHDHRADAKRVIRAFRKARLNMLVNESTDVQHNGCRIGIAGIDYANEDIDLARMVGRACASLNGQHDLKLLLAHHPHAFDAACRHGIDLTLSGHTHGGQFLLRKSRREKKAIGFGTLAWRYHSGHYHREQSKLFITSGLGSTFPVRVRCPAEIAVLELHAA